MMAILFVIVLLIPAFQNSSILPRFYRPPLWHLRGHLSSYRTSRNVSDYCVVPIASSKNIEARIENVMSLIPEVASAILTMDENPLLEDFLRIPRSTSFDGTGKVSDSNLSSCFSFSSLEEDKPRLRIETFAEVAVSVDIQRFLELYRDVRTSSRGIHQAFRIQQVVNDQLESDSTFHLPDFLRNEDLKL